MSLSAATKKATHLRGLFELLFARFTTQLLYSAQSQTV